MKDVNIKKIPKLSVLSDRDVLIHNSVKQSSLDVISVAFLKVTYLLYKEPRLTNSIC